MPCASSRARSILLFPIWEQSNLKFYIKFYLAVNVAVTRLPISSLEGGCNVQAFGFYIISSSFFFYVQLTSFGNFLGKASTKPSTELAKLLVELSLF